MLNALGSLINPNGPMLNSSAGSGNGQCPCPCSKGGKGNPPQGKPGSSCPNAKTNAIEVPSEDSDPILYLWGAAHENAADLSLSAAGVDWSLARGYINGAASAGGATTQGNNWMNNSSDKFIYGNAGTILLVVLDATSEVQFVPSGGGWALRFAQDTYSTLTTDSANHQYIFTNPTRNIRWTFNDLSVTAAPGRIKEETTLQLFSQGKSGFQYTYGTNGLVSQITTPTGQDYSILFTYDSNDYLTQV
jgi:hypothetical protein